MGESNRQANGGGGDVPACIERLLKTIRTGSEARDASGCCAGLAKACNSPAGALRARKEGTIMCILLMSTVMNDVFISLRLLFLNF
jgi:hypothetical protein